MTKTLKFVSSRVSEILNRSSDKNRFMEKVKIYQIGLGSFGRHGFEKFVHMAKHMEELDVELAGICDRDAGKLKAAEKFAEQHGLDPDTFSDKDRMYEEASGSNVLVYDAGPSDLHPGNIYESLQNGFHHLTEKPSSMDREEHIEEKRMAQDRDVTFAVDFIERENPVVKKALEIIEGEEIDSIKIFRESNMAVEKAIYPVERAGVAGGDIMDKMVHEAYVLDFLEASEGDYGLELDDVEAEFFVPKDFDSEKLLSLRGGYTHEIEDAATGLTHAKLSFNDVDVELHSSWMGASKEARTAAKDIEEVTGARFIDKDYFQEDGEAFVDEEARFFVIEGSRSIAGDMLGKRLYDLDTGEEIVTRDYLHDQLYRVLENSVREAAGLEKRKITDKETDVFMNALFDVREEAVEGKEFMEELEKGNNRLNSLRIRDGKILENEEIERIAG